MYVKCATCGEWIDVKPGRMNHVSHSLCPKCLDKAMEQLDRDAPPPGGSTTR